MEYSPQAKYFFVLKIFILIAFLIAVLAILFCFPPYAQSALYHDFADSRTFFGIPYFFDVTTSLLDLAIGIVGLYYLLSPSLVQKLAFINSKEQTIYIALFLGIVLLAFGSAYYHWDPNNDAMVLDRLPMTMIFAALLSAVIAERIHFNVGYYLLLPLIIFGFFAVFYWYETLLTPQGDLRLYIFTQIFPLFFIPVLFLLFKSPYTKSYYLLLFCLTYLVGKIFEYYDLNFFIWLGHTVSGHTIKHCLVSLAFLFILLYVLQRRPVARNC